MNISMLTASELLRICEPVTELEKRLFDICQELQQEAIDAIESIPPEPDEDFEDMYNDINEDCGLALEALRTGDIDAAKEILGRHE